MELFFKSVEENDLSTLKKILETGANINIKDRYGYSALHIASFKEFSDLDLLLIEKDIDTNIQDKNGQTILHYAALNNQLNIANAALSKGARLDIQDIYGNEPLWTAVFNDKGRNDRLEMIKLFFRPWIRH